MILYLPKSDMDGNRYAILLMSGEHYAEYLLSGEVKALDRIDERGVKVLDLRGTLKGVYSLLPDVYKKAIETIIYKHGYGEVGCVGITNPRAIAEFPNDRTCKFYLEKHPHIRTDPSAVEAETEFKVIRIPGRGYSTTLWLTCQKEGEADNA